MNIEIELKLPDNGILCVRKGVRVESIIDRLPKTPGTLIGIKIDNDILDLQTPIMSGGEIHLVTTETPQGLEVLRHSTAHLMASAVKELFPAAKVTIGPSIENGFYYDFDVEKPFTEEDLKRIEHRMAEIGRKKEPYVRREVRREEAIEEFQKLGEPYKVEIINSLEGETVSTYTHGTFTDLCRGPHLPNTGLIKAFKLTSVAGAYWRGDEKNRMLQRIYGTAFYSKEALSDYLKRLEEAKRNDHRILGQQLDLFSISETVGPGLVLWHPKGARIRNIIENFWREEHYKNGYELLYTPHIARIDMWNQSGHTGFYAENMFSPMDVVDQKYIVKPMNCPFHIQIYQSNLRSYRDLPFRWAELGTVYRFERSGVLHGLLRVRGFTQDDAHIMCRPDQAEAEVRAALKFCLFILRSFGFTEFKTFLSTRPEKFVGSLENWETATSILAKVLKEENVSYEIDPGEGVFYGPKIDVKILDRLGRAWQCSTIQVDFNLPERFDLSFIGEDGAKHRPIMIHRALMGSLERFFACLVEHYGGAFPMWLAPIQFRIMTVTDRAIPYGNELVDRLKAAGFRVEGDFRNEKLGYKIREAQNQKIPYMILLGDQELSGRKVSIRTRKGQQENGIEFDALVQRAFNEVQSKAL